MFLAWLSNTMRPPAHTSLSATHSSSKLITATAPQHLLSSFISAHTTPCRVVPAGCYMHGSSRCCSSIAAARRVGGFACASAATALLCVCRCTRQCSRSLCPAAARRSVLRHQQHHLASACSRRRQRGATGRSRERHTCSSSSRDAAATASSSTSEASTSGRFDPQVATFDDDLPHEQTFYGECEAAVLGCDCRCVAKLAFVDGPDGCRPNTTTASPALHATTCTHTHTHTHTQQTGSGAPGSATCARGGRGRRCCCATALASARTTLSEISRCWRKTTR
jgi:hypothetical protein